MSYVEDGGVTEELDVEDLEDAAFMFSFDPTYFFGVPKLVMQVSSVP